MPVPNQLVEGGQRERRLRSGQRSQNSNIPKGMQMPTVTLLLTAYNHKNIGFI